MGAGEVGPRGVEISVHSLECSDSLFEGSMVGALGDSPSGPSGLVGRAPDPRALVYAGSLTVLEHCAEVGLPCSRLGGWAATLVALLPLVAWDVPDPRSCSALPNPSGAEGDSSELGRVVPSVRVEVAAAAAGAGRVGCWGRAAR